MFNVHIVSTETIKPSSPTPENLRYLQLSLVDQLFPPVHSPIILLYSSNGTSEISSRLKKSLSELLTRFYPLAGRIKQEDHDALSVHTHVECNDDGVEFYEARVDGLLSEFLKQPLTEKPSPLLPYAGVSTDIPLVVQLSIFTCGGCAIGFLMSHVLADADSLFMFFKSWADSTRGEVDNIVSPIFGFSSIFPPRTRLRFPPPITTKDLQIPVRLPPSTKDVVVATRMFFEATRISLLREKVKASAGWLPTRFEAISALIWRCIMRSQSKAGHERVHAALCPVNIRRRMQPPLPENSFGNLIVLVSLTVNDDYGRYRLGNLERLLKEETGKMKGDYIRKVIEVKGEKGRWNLSDDDWKNCGIDICVFGGWVRYPIYEIDFGWGKPERYSSGSIYQKNCVLLTPTRNGDGGMEVWVFLEKGEMAKFKQDPELLAFVSVDADQEESNKNNKASLYGRGRL